MNLDENCIMKDKFFYDSIFEISNDDFPNC